VASGAGAGEVAPNFIINGYGDSNAFFYGAGITGADVDGDGIDDLVFSDQNYQHSPTAYPTAKGEVYVFKGGSLTGTHDLNTSAALMHTIRTEIEGNIGTRIAAIRQPRPGDTADWIAINSIGQRNVRIFKGTSNPSNDPGIEAGIVPASYATGEIASISYNSLDQTDWTGSTTGSRYGFELTTVTMGNDYLVVGSGTGDASTLFYSYDSGSDDLEKRAVIPGDGSEGNGLKIRGATVGGSGSLIMLNKLGYDSIRLK
jgi:hypothetical protein